MLVLLAPSSLLDISRYHFVFLFLVEKRHLCWRLVILMHSFLLEKKKFFFHLKSGNMFVDAHLFRVWFMSDVRLNLPDF